MSLSAGVRLGPYEILGVIGAGGMGEVYRATDIRLRRPVAVKVLRPSVRTGAAVQRERFRREALAIASLVHPNICRLYDVGTSDDIDYLVMEYLIGETLARRIARERQLPLDDATTIALQIAGATAEAHDRGFAHCDLNPGNVMMTETGAKLLDFGLAKLIPEPSISAHDSARSTTGTVGELIGTIQYMAPEQLEGRLTDGRVDLFAIGVILYEMLAGEPPFTGPSAAAIIAAILTQPPAPLRSCRSGVPRTLLHVIGRALEKDPDRRWPSAHALVDALCSITNRRKSPAQTTPHAQASHKPRSVRTIAVLPLSTGSDPNQQYLADGITDALITAISNIHDVNVISRTSADRLRTDPEGIAGMARHLGVEVLLEGTVARADSEIRVTARLIHAASQRCLWAETYQTPAGQLFSMYDDVARRIAAELQSRLRTTQRRHATAQPVDAQAEEAYLRARFHHKHGTAESLKVAFRYFEIAIGRYPGYALALAGLSRLYVSAALSRLLPASDAMAKARQSAQQALNINPALADAHWSIGNVEVFEWNLAAAESELKTSLRLNPSFADAYADIGRLYSFLRRHDEALLHVRNAQRLDPLSPGIHIRVVAVLYAARRFEEAFNEAVTIAEMEPHFGNALYLAGLCAYFRGNVALALEMLERARAAAPEHPSPLVGLAYVLARNGRITEAGRLVEELKERATRADVSPYDFAELYVGLGQIDLALEYLLRSRELHLPDLLGIGTDPLFDPIREHPRFERLVRELVSPEQ